MKVAPTTCDGLCTKGSSCCRETIVPVTDADVRRLMIATGLTANEIARLYSTADLEFDAAESWIQFPHGKRVLGLKRKSDESCRFLDKHGLCSVYEHRPATCRTFPYMVYFTDSGRVDEVTLHPEVECCGRLGKHWSKRKLLADARLEKEQDHAYICKIRRFEKKGASGGKQGFLEFLGLT